ncbi:MAG: hypothetical protein BWY20_02168 [Spirochaetes bacterium ADurb.Bin215]|nr:MAG: hypothetical protein BWY20_02168 [Spirochaetes bacterium ADurb.Bin215]
MRPATDTIDVHTIYGNDMSSFAHFGCIEIIGPELFTFRPDRGFQAIDHNLHIVNRVIVNTGSYYIKISGNTHPVERVRYLGYRKIRVRIYIHVKRSGKTLISRKVFRGNEYVVLPRFSLGYVDSFKPTVHIFRRRIDSILTAKRKTRRNDNQREHANQQDVFHSSTLHQRPSPFSPLSARFLILASVKMKFWMFWTRKVWFRSILPPDRREKPIKHGPKTPELRHVAPKTRKKPHVQDRPGFST